MADGRWQFSREPIPYSLQITVFYGQLFRKEVNLVGCGSQPFQDGCVERDCISDLKSQFSMKQ